MWTALRAASNYVTLFSGYNLSQKTRNSSFELLRILSMALIVMHHYTVHGGFDFMSPFSLRLYFVQCLAMGGKLGVNVFVLVSGYFLCKSNFKWQRLIKLELEVIFYSCIIGVIFFIFFPERESLKNLLGELTPLRSSRYWFYNTYFVCFLLSPFINKLISALNKDEFKKILILLSVLWVVIPFFPKFGALQMSELGWFIYLYLCAAYIRIFNDDFTKKSTVYILLGITGYILLLFSVLAFDLLGFIDSRFQSKFDYFLPMNSILVFASSLLLLIGFSKWNIGCKKGINTVASTTFGIYLIHDNHLLSPFLWIDLFKNATYLNTNTIFIHAFLLIIFIFVSCSLIDFIRGFLFEKSLFLIIEKIKENYIKNT